MGRGTAKSLIFRKAQQGIANTQDKYSLHTIQGCLADSQGLKAQPGVSSSTFRVIIQGLL